jgi:hypothetical protein
MAAILFGYLLNKQPALWCKCNVHRNASPILPQPVIRQTYPKSTAGRCYHSDPPFFVPTSSVPFHSHLTAPMSGGIPTYTGCRLWRATGSRQKNSGARGFASF